MDSREARKIDHIKYALALPDGPLATGFSDVHIMHNCLPELNREAVNLATNLAGIQLERPIIINAMTGGGKALSDINRKIAIIARETHCAMAVGSQYGAIIDNTNWESYRIARKENPHGIIFANVSALATVDEAKTAVDMLEAQALQIHLNVAQELVMAEGDRDFSGFLSAIESICNKLTVPVIAKETGCGMARTQVKALVNAGVRIIDIGGAGGTNFPAIEAARYKETNHELNDWGIPTVISLLEAVQVFGKNNGIIASGGLRSASDCLKAFALGASAVAMAGNLLRILNEGSIEAGCAYLIRLQSDLRDLMVLTASERIQDIGKTSVYFTGDTFQAIESLKIK
ncbi:Isopentenyl-diphosphate delta-isomerase [bioreactor metagenome]|jgi:isopentenyl-diphosphate delta-isomerase, type 2|uniref:Isopentenyl-diphosphate delta-isomerase n=1 Tax=bioreactor metagenome TaxID=1076179 RepID=A0A644TMS1_9ZZZZ|nr:type 2 isopentenyl-diphosphate Delta-isomerase [Acidaminococcaceae bacterium]